MSTKGPNIADVMVVGGGISGIQAALDLASSGYRVCLVERAPTIGGKMAQLDKTFPTNDCSMCIESPKFIECDRHPNIEILTYTEVDTVEGEAGDFEVTLTRKPRYVKEDICTGCTTCTEYCPIPVPDPFNQELSDNKAVHIYFSQAVPLVPYIDDRCRYLEDEEAVAIPHPLAQHWWGDEIRIYASVVEADHIINLCTPRTHGLGDFTMSLKNNVGVVNGPSRLHMHIPWGFKQRVAEIGLVVRPSLIVMDGREGFGDGGPDSGDRVRPGFIAAGSDPVAIDAVGLAHLRLEGANRAIGGRSIWEIPMMKRAVEIGLGIAGGQAIALVGVDQPTEAALRAQFS